MNVEARLKDLIGDAAGRLHTARSRNDQVATDFRLWVRRAIDDLTAALKDLIHALIDRADEHAATVMPATRICSRRSRSPSAITCWPMWRCWGATAALADARGG
jgi:hypothetical protein